MNCPKCGNVTNLMGSENIGVSVRRHRRCPKCDTKLMTYEIPEPNLKEALKFLDMEFLG